MTLGKGVFNLVRDINIMVYILYEQDYVDVEFFCFFFPVDVLAINVLCLNLVPWVLKVMSKCVNIVYCISPNWVLHR